MMNSGTADQVQLALASFLAGEKTITDLEGVLSAALRNGLKSRSQVSNLLEGPVGSGRVPRELLQRLALSSLDDATQASTAPKSTEAEPNKEPLGVGQLLAGRYRLERKLGSGGMGIVYQASDQEVVGETFAVKVLNPQIRDNSEALDLLREEVRRTRSLAHPNIVGVYSLNIDPQAVFILMECLEGKTLQDLLDQDFGRGMPPERAWPLIQDLGQALAYAHDRSIIHGDLKPANIFVTTSGRAKLLDFGIARAARGKKGLQEDVARGALTPAWASCEMLEYQPPDTRDDIYALSCILYEMLSGRRPFGDRNAVQARDAGEKPLAIPSLSVRQNAALAKGLSFERAARTSTVEALLAGMTVAAAVDKPRQSSSRIGLIATVLVLVAGVSIYVAAGRLGILGRSQRGLASVGTPMAEKSIAVLPFEDLSETKDQEYFADGLSQELAGVLGKVPNLRVISSTSSSRFKGTSDDLHSIGAQLGAAHVVRGSIRRAGNHIRVTAQLIRIADGAQEWSSAYDRSTDDVLQMQTEIAASLGRALELSVANLQEGSEAERPSAEAYDLYFRGLHANDRISNEALEEASSYLQRAIELDPQFVRAHEQLAPTHLLQAVFGSVSAQTAWGRVREDASQLSKIDPASGWDHALLCRFHTEYSYDWSEAERECAAALAVAPHFWLALYATADLAMIRGEYGKSERLFRSILPMDPLNADTHMELSMALRADGQIAEAEAEARRGLAITPTYNVGHFELGSLLLTQGRVEEARKMFELESPEYGQQAGLAMAYHALGRSADSAAALGQFIREHGANQPFIVARAYAYLGDPNQAFEWLDRAYQQRDPLMPYIKGQWLLRSDPRYKKFLETLNLPE